MLRWIVRENKLVSDVCEDTFWGDRIDGNAENVPDCVMATGDITSALLRCSLFYF